MKKRQKLKAKDCKKLGSKLIISFKNGFTMSLALYLATLKKRGPGLFSINFSWRTKSKLSEWIGNEKLLCFTAIEFFKNLFSLCGHIYALTFLVMIIVLLETSFELRNLQMIRIFCIKEVITMRDDLSGTWEVCSVALFCHLV